MTIRPPIGAGLAAFATLFEPPPSPPAIARAQSTRRKALTGRHNPPGTKLARKAASRALGLTGSTRLHHYGKDW